MSERGHSNGHGESGGEIGKSRRRTEDNRLIRGAGRYPDDLAPRDALHAVFVRSTLPHARITVDVAEAEAQPGVVAVLTADDFPAPGPVAVAQPRQPGQPRESMQTAPGGPDFKGAPAPIIAGGEVHHVGDPVALVLAETIGAARDAAALVSVDYEPLPSVSSVEEAVREGAVLVHPEHGTNVSVTTRRGTPAAEMDAIFAKAKHVVKRHLVVNRLTGVPIQPLTAIAIPSPDATELTVSCTTQSPWRVRATVAKSLGIPETQVRALAPDVGGGFGTRGPVYNEYLAVAHAAWRLKRAVRYTATRSEDLLASRAARDVVADAEIAADADGRILALRAKVLLNLGAYADTPGPGRRILECFAGPYATEGVSVELSGVFTNTSPTGAYRGAGRPEASYFHERLVDALALELKVDPAELRRRNFIEPDKFPYKTQLGPVYDSGNYAPALEQALAAIDYAGVRRRQAEARQSGSSKLIGIGIASYVEPTAAGFESGLVRVEASGRVTAFSGSHPQGQGHATTFAQIVAERLGVPFEWVTVRQGDTAAGPPGQGTGGSKSTALGGGALHEASERVLDKAKQIAAHLLEASASDVVRAEGGFAVAGAPTRKVDWPRVAATAYGGGLPRGMEPGLEATAYFHMHADPWSFGTCVAEVTVDRETGDVNVERLVSCDDCGVQINPLLLGGQSHGGLAQGLAAALFEWMQYDPEGQPLTGTLMDYAVPRAPDVPVFELGHTVTPSPWNPLGVKGHGESGTIAAPPAIVNAVIDALAPLGVDAIDPPLTAPRVWGALQRG